MLGAGAGAVQRAKCRVQSGDARQESGGSPGKGKGEQAAAQRDPDRALGYRLRKARERRRREQPIEEELTTIYVADDEGSGTPPSG